MINTEFICLLEQLLKDDLIAQIKRRENEIVVTFLNNQSYQILVEQI